MDASDFRMPMIDQHIAIGCACNRDDGGGNYENDLATGVEPIIAELLSIRLAPGKSLMLMARKGISSGASYATKA
jgi:hypothetical protein